MVSAQVTDDRVKLKMPDPAELKPDYTLAVENGPMSISSINTGVPHVVVEMEQIDRIDVVNVGREIRYHQEFMPAGTNVNFICSHKDNGIAIRTYERGVEDETLACGTGSIAGALITAHKTGKNSPIDVLTQSGAHLTIHFQEKEGQFYDVHLEGDARIIYKGEIWEDAWM
jgi:diaminopimelate epimerase